MENTNWQIVQQHLDAWKNKDFSRVKYAPDLYFKGPIDEFKTASAFRKTATEVSQMVADIVIQKKFIDGDNVAVLYDFVTNSPLGTMAIAEFYELENGVIKSIKTIFDPREDIALTGRVAAK
jgi:hypothetical protein